MKKLMYLLTLMALTCGLVSTAMGQNKGALKGVIEDHTGAPVPNVEVKLIDKTTDETFETVCSEAGQFEFTDLPIAKYLLMVEVEGFQKAEVPVKVGTTNPPLRVRLKIAAIAEQVTVTATSPSAEENIDVVEVNDDWLRALPVKDGDLLSVGSIFLDPAATGSAGATIVVDGVESSNLDLPLSSIKKVYINKNPYAAEFGRPGRGRIEVVTKSGSRHHFHRNVFLTFRDSALDARNAFARVRPPMQRELFEGEVDGPLGDKVTFFMGGTYFINNKSAVITAQTPAGRVVENFATPDHRTRLFGRLDFRLNPQHTLVARYKFKNNSEPNRGVGGFNLPERMINSFKREHEIRISESAIFSSTFSNELRFSFKRERQADTGVTNQPAIIVRDAFRGGGAQVSYRQRETALDIQDIATLIKGKHGPRFGVGVKPRFFHVSDASNFGGAFTFSSLSTFAENRPFLFTVNQGDPTVSYAQHEFYYFAQDEIRLRPNLSLSFGLRHEFQSNVDNHNNFAPRLAFAYAPGDRRTILRAGAGVFYERQPEILQRQSLLYDGVRIHQVVISNPGFPLAFDPSAIVRFPTPSVVRIAPNIRAPYLMQASLGVERKLGRRKNYLALEYTTLRGLKLYRMRNINAPPPGSGRRPDPNFISINQFESSGTSRSNSLRVTFQADIPRWVELLSQYTLSRTTDDTAGLFSFPANSYDLASERGRADFDRRHQLNMAGIVRLPWHMKLGIITSLSSDIPFNITTGFDDYRDTVAKARPPGVTRNTRHGPGFANVDMLLIQEAGDRKKRQPAEGRASPGRI